MSDLTIERDAYISVCGRYRYLLRRTWDHAKPRALFVMLNPSTADAELDDATIRSCMRLSRGLHYGSFEVVNLHGLRSTDAGALKIAADPIGPENDRVIEAAINRCDVAICAWGQHWTAPGRPQRVAEILRVARPAIFCLGRTKSGAPKHPLYIKTGTPLEVFAP